MSPECNYTLASTCVLAYIYPYAEENIPSSDEDTINRLVLTQMLMLTFYYDFIKHVFCPKAWVQFWKKKKYIQKVCPLEKNDVDSTGNSPSKVYIR